MQLMVIGLNHKTAPVDVRERFSIPKEALRKGLANLAEYSGINEAVVLSTCTGSYLPHSHWLHHHTYLQSN